MPYRALTICPLLVLLTFTDITRAAAGESLETLLSRADQLTTLRQYSQADEKLEWAWHLAKTDSERARVRLAQADLLADISRDPSAIREILGEPSAPIDATLRKVREAQDAAAGRYYDALEYSRRGAGSADTHAAAVNNLAVLWLDQGYPEKAARLLTKELPSAPAEALGRIYYNLGVAFERKGDLGEAFGSYASAARSEPELTKSYSRVFGLIERLSRPEDVSKAAELVNTVRESGQIELAEQLLMKMLVREGWQRHPEYRYDLIGQLALLAAPDVVAPDRFTKHWNPFLEDLVPLLPVRSAQRIENLLWVSSPSRLPPEPEVCLSSVENWLTPESDKARFSDFVKQYGDYYFRQEDWMEAFSRYRCAALLTPDSQEVASYLLNLIAHAPENIDPEGEVAAEVLQHLEKLRAAQFPIKPGVFQLAGAALRSRERYTDALNAYEISRGLYPENAIAHQMVTKTLEELIARQELEVPPRFENQDSIIPNGLWSEEERILANLRLKFPLLAQMDVVMGDLTPSGFEGLDEGSFDVRGRHQKFLVSKDNTALYLLQGEAIDVSRSAEEVKAELAERAEVEARQAEERASKLEQATVGLPFRGKADAPVTIVEFSDFQCPYCSRGAETMDQILEKYPNDVKVVFKHFPLSFHPWAKTASIAAICAGNQESDAFWTLHDRYFEEQRQLTRENVLDRSRDFLASSGIDMAAWTACAMDTETAAYKAASRQVEDDMALGQSIGVTGTPGFFVNGRFLSGAQPITVFEPLVESAKDESGGSGS